MKHSSSVHISLFNSLLVSSLIPPSRVTPSLSSFLSHPLPPFIIFIATLSSYFHSYFYLSLDFITYFLSHLTFILPFFPTLPPSLLFLIGIFSSPPNCRLSQTLISSLIPSSHVIPSFFFSPLHPPLLFLQHFCHLLIIHLLPSPPLHFQPLILAPFHLLM